MHSPKFRVQQYCVHLATSFLALCNLAFQAPAPPAAPAAGAARPDRSAYYAFVDREFIFTVEIVNPGVPLFNFISMTDEEHSLAAKEVRLTLETRKVPAVFFLVDTGNPKEPVVMPSVRMRPRSSFGVRLKGDFGKEKEVWGAAVRVGNEEFRLVPLTSFEFENLAQKVNRLNLESPDFTDDWRVLKLDFLGTRHSVRRR